MMRKRRAYAAIAALAVGGAPAVLNQPVAFAESAPAQAIVQVAANECHILRVPRLFSDAPFTDVAELHAALGLAPAGAPLGSAHSYKQSDQVVLSFGCQIPADAAPAVAYLYDIGGSGKASKPHLGVMVDDAGTASVNFGKLGRGEYYAVLDVAESATTSFVAIQRVSVGNVRSAEEPTTQTPSEDPSGESGEPTPSAPSEDPTAEMPASSDPTTPTPRATSAPQTGAPIAPIQPGQIPTQAAPEIPAGPTAEAPAPNQPQMNADGAVPPPAQGPFESDPPLFDELTTFVIPPGDGNDDAGGSPDTAPSPSARTPMQRESDAVLEILRRGDFILQEHGGDDVMETAGPLEPRDGTSGDGPRTDAEPPVIINKNAGDSSSQNDGNEALLLGVAGGVVLLIGGVGVALYRLRR